MKTAAKPIEKVKKPATDLPALHSDVRKAEERLAKLSEMRAKLSARMADPALYEAARKADLDQFTAKFAELEEAEHRAEALWLEAQERLEAAEAG